MFRCDSKVTDQWGTQLSFNATQGESGAESKAFHDATPYGSLTMGIAAGKPAADYFEQGKNYYLSFEKAE